MKGAPLSGMRRSARTLNGISICQFTVAAVIVLNGKS